MPTHSDARRMSMPGRCVRRGARPRLLATPSIRSARRGTRSPTRPVRRRRRPGTSRQVTRRASRWARLVDPAEPITAPVRSRAPPERRRRPVNGLDCGFGGPAPSIGGSATLRPGDGSRRTVLATGTAGRRIRPHPDGSRRRRARPGASDTARCRQPTSRRRRGDGRSSRLRSGRLRQVRTADPGRQYQSLHVTAASQ